MQELVVEDPLEAGLCFLGIPRLAFAQPFESEEEGKKAVRESEREMGES